MNDRASAYFRAVDPFPLQGGEHTRVARFYEALQEGRLLTTSCSDCDRRHWPPRVVCPVCLSDRLDWVELPKQGTLHVFTVQETGVPPGFPRPSIFAVVRVGELHIFTRLVDTPTAGLKRGAAVRLAPEAVQAGPDGEARCLPTFTVTAEPDG